MDPSSKRKVEAAEACLLQTGTVEQIAEEYLERLKLQGRAEKAIEKNRWLLEYVRPTLGQRMMRDISAPEILEVLRKVEVRGRHETANRLRGTLSTLFRYAIATGRAQHDPASDLRGALITPKVKHRAAIIGVESLRWQTASLQKSGDQGRPRLVCYSQFGYYGGDSGDALWTL
ncbi:hypothetical protein LWE61_03135 [Sphingobium sufflavum]|uniref:tyrosine-type recombinase/integrase n=1 Tax=Sphingobium sufflavum TaxID=1129547 RepID=UPI001F15AAB3|nr:hypothetical protein [Sphingobium sufflavum]MCE7795546.1 hypothetical protein [Sphingobium sufflavum]